MVIEFKINMLLNNKRQSIIYPLSEEESYLLIDGFDIDFLNIPMKSEVVTLSIDVLFEDKETVENIVTLLADMFPNNISKFKEKLKNKKNVVEQYIETSKKLYIHNSKDVIIELDKLFMMYYFIYEQKDRSNLNRNIVRKMKKLGIVTVNYIPIIKRVSLSDKQLLEVKEKSIIKGKIKNNFYILEAKELPSQKWTNENTDYYIYLYRKGVDFVQNEKSVFYIIVKPKNKDIESNFETNYTELAINNQNLFSRCRLFKDIIKNKKSFSWKEFLGILSNIKNAKIKFKDNSILATSYLLEHLHAHYQDFAKTLIRFFRANNSYEIECNEYCPYKSTCHHAKNMLSTIHIKKNQIVKLDRKENYITLEEARKQLDEKAENLYNNLLNKKIDMGVLIAQPGIGKTEKVIELIDITIKAGMGCIYAVPNRKTIDNFVARLEEKGIYDYIVTPVIEDLEDDRIQKEIKYFQDIGAYNKLKKYLYSLLKKNKLSSKDSEIIEEYLTLNEDIQSYDGLIITTHKRFPYFTESVYENKIAFVDEDVFDSDFTRETTMPINKVEDIINNSSFLSMVKLNEVKKMKDNIVRPIFPETFEPKAKELIEEELINMRKNPINIFDFFSCTAIKKYYDGYKYKVKCFNFSKMPNIPILITSATAEREFYQLVYGKERNLQIEEVEKAKYKGRIILWDSHTYSQTFMDDENNIEYIEELIEKCKFENMNLITFKDFIEKNKSVLVDDEKPVEPKLLDGIECYNFFSILGLDSLKDNDLAVIGKPLKDEDIFYFLALLVYNKKYKENTFEEQRCKTQIVEDKGFLFNLYTYNDETLRKIQMWSISSNEEQYTGRARVISNGTRTVYLASGYPVEQLEIEDEEV